MRIRHDIQTSMWGQVQHCVKLAEGIWAVSTAGHGGYVLSSDRAKEFKKRMPKFNSSYSSSREFEEDCDWQAVVLAFPEEFEAKHVERVVESASKSTYFPIKYAYEQYMKRHSAVATA